MYNYQVLFKARSEHVARYGENRCRTFHRLWLSTLDPGDVLHVPPAKLHLPLWDMPDALSPHGSWAILKSFEVAQRHLTAFKSTATSLGSFCSEYAVLNILKALLRSFEVAGRIIIQSLRMLVDIQFVLVTSNVPIHSSVSDFIQAVPYFPVPTYFP